jgi:HEAT repeat protein
LREIALEDPSEHVRQSAVVALEQIGGDLAASTLVDVAASNSNSETLRANALLALARVAQPAQRDALLTLLMDALHDPSTPQWLREPVARELERMTH